MDSKGRLTIPARFRESLEAGLAVTKGYETCLVIYPLDEWARLAEKVARMPLASRTARSYGRWVFGGAHETSLDAMGRILIPAFLRSAAGIEQEAVVVGVNTYIEVWSPREWDAAQARDAQNIDEILADAARMGV